MLRLKSQLAHGLARFAEIIDPENTTGDSRLDEAVVTFFASPNSYTAEDVIEIAAHGSPVILEMLVRRAVASGARLAEPGEFTQRAFLSGRIDLTQAEAVRDLIEAQTLYQARVAAGQLGGSLSRRIQPIKQALVELIAVLEAGIDFAEDDIDVISNADVHNRLLPIVQALRPLEASFAHGRVVHAGLTLAIVGRPNVGKSSLFNRLVERDRAIVTALPGTTRDLVTEIVSISGIPVRLIDTAGLREATDEAESIGIQKSREALADADLVLIVLDASVETNGEELVLLSSLEGRRALVALNKVDLVVEDFSHLSSARPSLSIQPIPVSAITGQGIAELRERLLAAVRGTNFEEQTGMLTNIRQQESVAAATTALAAADHALDVRTPHEMLLLDLYSALRALDALTGETTSDDVLNLIFSSFCIGK